MPADAAELLHRSAAQTDRALEMLEASQERERVNMNTIHELTLALRVSENDNRELRARVRAYERGAGDAGKGFEAS